MVLHLANDYAGSTVYKNFFSALDSLGVTQTVYTAVRSEVLVDRNKISFQEPESKIIYSNILNTYSRINFYYKRNRIVEDIEKKVNDLSNFRVTHSHTWFSDGAVAYYLFRKYGIPYIVTIRNTDLNLFLKYMFHLRGLGINILKAAKKIVFISPHYLRRFREHPYIQKKYPDFISKSIVLPNGVADFWVNNTELRKKQVNDPIRLLYIGNFSKNKNVSTLIDAVVKLNHQSKNYILNLVGGGKDKNKIENKIKNLDFVTFDGPIYDTLKLKEIIKSSDIFVMPSHFETFGLVYIEALSQGIPVLYTKNEGIDGLYGNIGESVTSKNIDSIAAGIEKIALHYSSYNFKPIEIVENHNWNMLASKYKKIYNSIIDTP